MIFSIVETDNMEPPTKFLALYHMFTSAEVLSQTMWSDRALDLMCFEVRRIRYAIEDCGMKPFEANVRMGLYPEDDTEVITLSEFELTRFYKVGYSGAQRRYFIRERR